MKKFYMILAAVAAMAMSAQAAQEVKYGSLQVGDFENPTEVYNTSYFSVAPTNFYVAHTGSQMIFTANELQEMQGKYEVKVNKISFKFRNEDWYEDITRDVVIYMQAIDETAFPVVKDIKQFFTFDNPVAQTTVTYNMLEYYYEDVVMSFDLKEPFLLPAGKNLLVTIVFDAQDDDNCTYGTDAVPFYTSGVRHQAMTYTNNTESFIDYAQGEFFPDATATLGCGTDVELPVTLIDFTYKARPTAVDEVQAARVQDNVYYNLMGQKFSGDNLPAGIYIHNGEKVLVK